MRHVTVTVDLTDTESRAHFIQRVTCDLGEAAQSSHVGEGWEAPEYGMLDALGQFVGALIGLLL
jgi:hypothetical protein